MMLTQMKLNVLSAQVRRDMADPYEMHRTIQRLTDGQERRPLWRLEHDGSGQHPVVLLQTEAAPDRRLLDEFDSHYLLDFGTRENRLLANISAEDVLNFRLHANPTVTRLGKRHGLVEHDDQVAWIARVLDRHGAALHGVRIGASRRMVSGRRRGSKPMIVTGVTFDGQLGVLDADSLRELVSNGIGHAKALGLGLMTLAR